MTPENLEAWRAERCYIYALKRVGKVLVQLKCFATGEFVVDADFTVLYKGTDAAAAISTYELQDQ